MGKNRIYPFLGVCLLLATTSFAAQTQPTSTSKVVFVGEARMNAGPAPQQAKGRHPISWGPEVNVSFNIPGVSGNNSPARVKAAHVPTPSGNSIVSGTFSGFLGLTEFEQAFIVPAGLNGFNFETEPPDQGLAVGNGFVVEAVNSAIAVYDTSGNVLFLEALNPFFNLNPEITFDPATGAISFGPFLADPRVYYDASTGHFFVSIAEVDVDPVTGNLAGTSHLMVAVSLDANPLDGFNIFQLEVTNDGDAVFGACPCFGDEPLIGADANGFYFSTDAFSLATFTFRGAQIYAISKAALEATFPSSSTITAVHFGNLTEAEGFPTSIQPAIVPPRGSFVSDNGGTEYFVNALDFTRALDNRLGVWALMNSSSLDSATPSLTLVNEVIDTEAYGFPPATEQKPGPTPLLDLLASPLSPVGVFKNHEELIEDNNDRLQNVTFANGMLWTSVPSVVKTPEGPVRAGAAWFILSPSVGGGQLNASVFNQGYVAINSPNQNSVLFPAVGVNAAGKAVMAFSIAGEDFFPSAGYATLDAANGAGPIVISAPGVAPDDGFSGYRPIGPDFRAGRWGDYSWAVSDESGNIWLGAEMIPTEQAPFVPFANWGTFITEVTP